MLALDHVFCFVSDPGRAARRLEDDGWVLDAGQAHAGQGTRNRRLPWREHNERFPERPLVFVLELTEAEMQRRPRTQHQRGDLREIRVRGPAAPSLPRYAGPPIVHEHGAHQLELVVDQRGTPRPIADGMVLRW